MLPRPPSIYLSDVGPHILHDEQDGEARASAFSMTWTSVLRVPDFLCAVSLYHKAKFSVEKRVSELFPRRLRWEIFKSQKQEHKRGEMNLPRQTLGR